MVPRACAKHVHLAFICCVILKKKLGKFKDENCVEFLSLDRLHIQDCYPRLQEVDLFLISPVACVELNTLRREFALQLRIKTFASLILDYGNTDTATSCFVPVSHASCRTVFSV